MLAVEIICRVREDKDFARADLAFSEVDHSGLSFQTLIFFNKPSANENTSRELDSGFAGSFTVFGHGGCIGAPGHCDVSAAPRSPFDLQPPHPLTPTTVNVVVTDALRYVLKSSKKRFESITPVPITQTPRNEDRRVDRGCLKFKDMDLRIYG